MPSSNDMLHIFAIVSAKSGSSCLMSHVGAGSSRQVFEGEAPIILEISSDDTGLNLDRVGICLGSITGGMTPDVACRILSILVWKKSANSSAETITIHIRHNTGSALVLESRSTFPWYSRSATNDLIWFVYSKLNDKLRQWKFIGRLRKLSHVSGSTGIEIAKCCPIVQVS